MLKTSLFAAAAALTLAACAGNAGTQSTTSAATPYSAPQAAAPPAPEAAAPPSPTATATPATPATPTHFSDAQLRSFAAASHDIQPLNTQLTSGTPEQRNTAVNQVRSILARNNLDSATYNAIAAQAQSDPALAARIASLNPGSSPG